MQEEILYRAQNSKSSMIFALLCSLFMIGFVVLIQIFKLEYSSRPFISTSSTLDWILIGVIITAISMIIVSINSYFTNFLCITKNAILMKLGVIHQKILFKDIELIKSYIAGRYSQGIAGKAYTVIKMKNGIDVLAPDIIDLEDFTNKIKIYYPQFNNDKGIIESYNDAINYSVFLTAIMLGFATFLVYIIFNMNILTLVVQILWVIVIILYICGFYQLVKLIKQFNKRYFSEETKMMLASIKTSEKKLKELEAEKLNLLNEQEEESIVTNYCPICGSKLIDFKCNRCDVNLDNIYDSKKHYCINCGTKRKDLEPDCLNCGLSFNL